MRPVRLAPCAAGASPTIKTRAAGSPKEGTGLPQYVQSRKARRRAAAIREQCSRKRGHSSQRAIAAWSWNNFLKGASFFIVPAPARPVNLLVRSADHTNERE